MGSSLKRENGRTARPVGRRDFLKVSGSSLGLLLAGMPTGLMSGAYTATGRKLPKFDLASSRLPIFDDSDGADLGLFEKYGHRKGHSEEASSAIIRDR